MRPINQADRDAAWNQYQKEEHDKKVNSYAQSNNLDMSKPGDRVMARWGSFRADQEKQQAAQREANLAKIRAQAQAHAPASNSTAPSGAQPTAGVKPATTTPAQAPAGKPSGAATPTPASPAPVAKPSTPAAPNPGASSGSFDQRMAQKAQMITNLRNSISNPVNATGGNGVQKLSATGIKMPQ